MNICCGQAHWTNCENLCMLILLNEPRKPVLKVIFKIDAAVDIELFSAYSRRNFWLFSEQSACVDWCTRWTNPGLPINSLLYRLLGWYQLLRQFHMIEKHKCLSFRFFFSSIISSCSLIYCFLPTCLLFFCLTSSIPNSIPPPLTSILSFLSVPTDMYQRMLTSCCNVVLTGWLSSFFPEIMDFIWSSFCIDHTHLLILPFSSAA